MGEARSIPPSLYEAATLEQMRSWTVGCGGATKMYDKAERWRKEEEFMRGLAEEFEAELKTAGARIESRSGEAMQNAMSPVKMWVDVAADNALAQEHRMREQGDAYRSCETSIPSKAEEMPVPDETVGGQIWAGLSGGKTDHDAAMAHNEKLRQDGVVAFNTYDATSRATVSATPVFQEPPKGGIDATVKEYSGYQQVGSMRTPTSGGGNPAGTYSASTGSGTYSPTSGTASSSYTPRPGVGSGYTAPAGTSSAWSNFTPTPVQPWQRDTLDVSGTGRVPGSVAPGVPSTTGGPRTGTDAGTGSGKGVAGGRGSGTPVNVKGRGVGTRVPIKGLGSLGAGGSSGFAPRAVMPGTTSSAASSISSATGRSGMMRGAPMGGNQQGGDDEEEHETPEYLKGDYGYFDGDLPRVAPPVIE